LRNDASAARTCTEVSMFSHMRGGASQPVGPSGRGANDQGAPVTSIARQAGDGGVLGLADASGG